MPLHSDELRLYLAVVEAGSFSAAAEHLGQTVSGVSRAVARLEARLGVTLLARTTRRMEPTEEGRLFLRKAEAIVAALDEAEESLRTQHRRPAGRLRVDAASPFMLHAVVPQVPAFREAYPDILLELTSNDRIIDLVEQRVDVAIRIGPLSDSSLHARTLKPYRLRLLASPDYLARRGRPRSVRALGGHTLLGFTRPDSLNLWPLRHAGGTELAVTPSLAASSGETLRQLALLGQGIVCLADFMTREDRRRGRLVPVLESALVEYSQPVHAVYYRNTPLSARISAFLDFLQGRL